MTNNDPISSTLSKDTNWLFIGIGSATIVITVAPLLYSLHKRFWLGSRSPGLVALWVMLLLPLASIFRVADLIIVADQLTGSPSGQNFSQVVLGGAPGYLKSRVSKGEFLRHIVSVWAVCTCSIFIVWILLLMLMASMPNHFNLLHLIEAGYSSLLALTISALFLLWGFLLYRKLRHKQTPSSRSGKVLQSIVILCAVCFLIFLIRSVCVFLDAFVVSNSPVGLYVDHWLLYVLCEFLSAWLLIAILLRPASKKTDLSAGSSAAGAPFKPQYPTRRYSAHASVAHPNPADDAQLTPDAYLFSEHPRSSTTQLSDAVGSDSEYSCAQEDSDFVHWDYSLSECEH